MHGCMCVGEGVMVLELATCPHTHTPQEGRGLVHRDLATRNVLVVSNAQIKVSDFGLARQFKDDKDYYPASNNKDVPIFW